MVGFINEYARSTSGAFSSFAHFSRFLVMKTISFSINAISPRYASCDGFPRSRCVASKMRLSRSLILCEER